MPTDSDREREDLLEALRAARGFLRYSVRGLTDEQARQRPTASELCLAGIVKHVAQVESNWFRFIIDGPTVMEFSKGAVEARADGFRMLEGETLDGLLADYEEVGIRTDDLVRSLPSLDADKPLPAAPWFEPGARRSARRVFMHIVSETAQHAGHADIIRESIDGQKTMG